MRKTYKRQKAIRDMRSAMNIFGPCIHAALLVLMPDVMIKYRLDPKMGTVITIDSAAYATERAA